MPQMSSKKYSKNSISLSYLINCTLKSDGQAKVRWYAPNPNRYGRQSPMALVQSPTSDSVTRLSAMVLI